jgi:hypothetical protein
MTTLPLRDTDETTDEAIARYKGILNQTRVDIIHLLERLGHSSDLVLEVSVAHERKRWMTAIRRLYRQLETSQESVALGTLHELCEAMGETLE